jgi:CRP-like cAMP-binding protein
MFSVQILDKCAPMRKKHTLELPSSFYRVRNSYLLALSDEQFSELRRDLRFVALEQGAILSDAQSKASSVYFVESGLICRSIALNGEDHLVALVGSSEYVGASVILGTMKALHKTSVLVPGNALRIDAMKLADAVTRRPAVRQLLLGYVDRLTREVSCSAACNSHSIQGRLSRFLSQATQKVGAAELPFTHEALASILKVRRAGISEGLEKLELAGVVVKRRGSLQISDHQALAKRACTCCS